LIGIGHSKRWLRIVAVLGLASLGASLGIVSSAHSAQISRITIDGPISPASSDFIATAIDQASSAGSLMLVIEMDTPGGLLDSTKTIVQNIMASPIPVAVFVYPSGGSATSAGVFVTMAADIAAMAPGTTIGSAHPVTGSGQDIEGDMRKKVENFTVAFFESIAEQRGRNVEWAEQAVRESVSVTATEAVALNVVDFVAADLESLVEQAEGRTVQVAGKDLVLEFDSARDSSGALRVVDIEMTLRQQVLNLITHPNIIYLLMMAGMLGLYMELSNPGAVVPGVVGGICLLLALLGGQVLPISSTGMLLIALGMMFLVAELFIPSFGILGFGGVVAVTLGSLFLYTPESALFVDRSLIFATSAVFATAIGALLILVVRDRRQRVRTGSEGLIGEVGVVAEELAPEGKVRVHGEIWGAVAEGQVSAGQKVRVDGVEGLVLRVSKKGEELK
jgi:membrane-bound serine protease (ClpP class)